MAGFLEGGGYEKWLGQLGVSDAPLTRDRLAKALRFFHAWMPELGRDRLFQYLRGIDLHKPVQEVVFPPHTLLAAYRFPGPATLSAFYTKPGTSVHGLGVAPAGRRFVRFEVVAPAHALESRAAGIRDTWSSPEVAYLASGGGLQYVVAQAARTLREQAPVR